MANPLSIADDWLYHLGRVSNARAKEIGASGADLVIIEQSDLSGDKARYYTPKDLDVMRGGTDKLIASYISIGEAETYRAYWKSSWQKNPPKWLGEENPNWEGNIKVEYWDPKWQAIVFKMVDQMVDQGFNGLYLDIIDAFQYFEEVAPNRGINYRSEMVEFVAAIRAHALDRIAQTDPGRDFVIIGQNGADLVEDPRYLAVIDGIGQEDLRFAYSNPDREGDFHKQSKGDYTYVLDLLMKAEAAGKSTFVVEYMTKARQSEYSSDLAKELATLTGKGIPLYIGEGRDLSKIYDQGNATGLMNDKAALNQTGTGANERFTGTANDDRISGGGGNDTLKGAAGDDVLRGQKGHDVLRGNGGDDQLSGHKGNDLLKGNSGDDVLRGGKGADNLFGGGGVDRLFGHRGDDQLKGGRGDDRLRGGTGDDDLHGGKGSDTFIFNGTFGYDVIVDFELARDRLQTTGLGDFTATRIAGGVALEFAGGNGIEIMGLKLGQVDDILFV